MLPIYNSFLTRNDQAAVACLSKHYYASSLGGKLISNPGKLLARGEKVGVLMGFSNIFECHCIKLFSRLPTHGIPDCRNIGETALLKKIQQLFAHKDHLRVCAIGPGGCYQPVVLHAHLSLKLRKKVDWLLVDPFSKMNEKKILEEFTIIAKAFNPNAKIDTLPSLNALLTTLPCQRADVFITFDAGLLGEKSGKGLMQRMSLLANHITSLAQPSLHLFGIKLAFQSQVKVHLIEFFQDNSTPKLTSVIETQEPA